MTIDDFLEAGIEAYQAGDLTLAQSALARAVKSDPSNANAWLWLGRALEDREKKRFCFARAVRLDPANLAARQEVEDLDHEPVSPSPLLFQAAEQNPIKVAPQTPEEIPQDVVPPTAPVVIPTASTPKSGWLSRGLLIGGIGALLLACTAAIVLLVWYGLGGNKQLTVADALVLPTTSPTVKVGLTPFPPTWTTTPTATRRPSSTPIPTPTLSILSMEDMRTTLVGIASQEPTVAALAAHDEYQLDVKFCETITGYTDDPAGGIERAKCYWQVMNHFPVGPDTIDALHRAIKEMDQAIASMPDIADYYDFRATLYHQLNTEYPNRVDRDWIYQVMLDNYRMAERLEPGEEIYPLKEAWTLVLSGHCTESLNLYQQLLSADPDIVNRSAAFDEGIAEAYYCLGQPDQAMSYAEYGINAGDACSCRWEKAYYLYMAGNLQEAKDILENTPSRNDDRMFLIGLMDYELGDIDAARMDLEFGEVLTWNRHGLHAYLAGKLALEDGDREAAIANFQDAEASLPYRQLKLLPKIRADLAKLGASPLNPPGSFKVTTTPIPSLTPLPPFGPSKPPATG